MKKLIVFIFTLSLIFSSILAKETAYLARSPRALLMGDAFTAIADDEYTLFYNPAALARNKGVEVALINPSFGVTNALGDLDRFENFPSSDASAIADRLLGFPVYLKAGAAPSLKIGPFGFATLFNSKTSVVLRNKTHPLLDIDYRYDRGFLFGYSHTFGNGGFNFGASKKKSVQGHRTSLGLTWKYLNRQGISSGFDLFGTKLLRIINSGVDNITDVREGLGYAKGTTMGFDMGVEHVYTKQNSELSFGFSILDIGKTQFRKRSGAAGAEVPTQEMFINAGTAWRQDFGAFRYTLSFDLHPLNMPIDFGRKVHMGAKAGIPGLDFYGGFSEGYFSYGLELTLYPMTLVAGFYSVESGVKYKEEENKRAVIYLSLFNFAFDL